MTNTNKDVEDGQSANKEKLIRSFHFGGFAGIGIRINNPNKRTAINYMPICINIASNGFFEFNSKIEVDIKL